MENRFFLTEREAEIWGQSPRMSPHERYHGILEHASNETFREWYDESRPDFLDHSAGQALQVSLAQNDSFDGYITSLMYHDMSYTAEEIIRDHDNNYATLCEKISTYQATHPGAWTPTPATLVSEKQFISSVRP